MNDREKEKKHHLFVREHDVPVAVQNGLEGERTHTEVFTQGKPVPLNHQCRSWATAIQKHRRAHMLYMFFGHIKTCFTQPKRHNGQVCFSLSHRYQSKAHSSFQTDGDGSQPLKVRCTGWLWASDGAHLQCKWSLWVRKHAGSHKSSFLWKPRRCSHQVSQFTSSHSDRPAAATVTSLSMWP